MQATTVTISGWFLAEIIIIEHLIAAFIGMTLWKNKRGDPSGAFVLCAILGILGVLILAIATPKRKEIAKGGDPRDAFHVPTAPNSSCPKPASARTASMTSPPPHRHARGDHRRQRHTANCPDRPTRTGTASLSQQSQTGPESARGRRQDRQDRTAPCPVRELRYQSEARRTAMTNRQVIPGVYVEPRVTDTAKGKVEFDLTEGDGPVVLSVHAGMGGADQGRLNADWLAGQGYRILSPSRPGYLGTPLDSGTTVEDQAGLLAALLDTLDIGQVAVVAHSAGGPVAYTLAGRHPERVVALVAISGLSGPRALPETGSGSRVRDAIFLSTPGQKLLQFAIDRLPRAFLTGTLSQTGHLAKPERKALVDHVLNSPQALAYVKGITAMMDPYSERAQGVSNDFRQSAAMSPLPFANITCPTLIMHGTRDALAEFSDGVRAYESIKGAERYWIEGGDHLAFWLSPQAPAAQASARAFLHQHIKSGTPTAGH
jgi:pimeloyl-ACP methyl ester carboxylesterase